MLPESWFAARQRMGEIHDYKQRRLMGMVVETEAPKGRHPDFKGEGVAVWKEKTKDGKPYLSIVVLNSIRVRAFLNEVRQEDAGAFI